MHSEILYPKNIIQKFHFRKLKITLEKNDQSKIYKVREKIKKSEPL